MFRGSIPSGWVSTIGSADSNHSFYLRLTGGSSAAAQPCQWIGYAQSGPILFCIRFPLRFQADLRLAASGFATQTIVSTSRLALALLAGPMAPVPPVQGVCPTALWPSSVILTRTISTARRPFFVTSRSAVANPLSRRSISSRVNRKMNQTPALPCLPASTSISRARRSRSLIARQPCCLHEARAVSNAPWKVPLSICRDGNFVGTWLVPRDAKCYNRNALT